MLNNEFSLEKVLNKITLKKITKKMLYSLCHVHYYIYYNSNVVVSKIYYKLMFYDQRILIKMYHCFKK